MDLFFSNYFVSLFIILWRILSVLLYSISGCGSINFPIFHVSHCIILYCIVSHCIVLYCNSLPIQNFMSTKFFHLFKFSGIKFCYGGMWKNLGFCTFPIKNVLYYSKFQKNYSSKTIIFSRNVFDDSLVKAGSCAWKSPNFHTLF
jgi:hypothetical protein